MAIGYWLSAFSRQLRDGCRLSAFSRQLRDGYWLSAVGYQLRGLLIKCHSTIFN